VHVLGIIGRIAAGCVAALAFYMAFFMYENEQGVLQNRLESLWTKINDRAKATESTSVAIFNVIGNVLNGAADRIFGKRLFSYRALANSVNLALIGGGIRSIVDKFTEVAQNHSPNFVVIKIHVPPLGLVLAATVLLISVYSKRFWASVIAGFPMFVIIIGLIYSTFWGIRNNGNADHMEDYIIELTFVAAILFSFISDLIVVILLRSALRILSTALTNMRIIAAISGLIVLAIFLEAGPIEWYKSISPYHWSGPISVMRDFAQSLGYFNCANVAMCLVPGLMFLFVLLHRVLWPTLSRLFYPVASRNVITNSKVLVSVGTLCLTFAFNLEHVGLQQFLKLLS
jgi:hypothetical protein